MIARIVAATSTAIEKGLKGTTLFNLLQTGVSMRGLALERTSESDSTLREE